VSGILEVIRRGEDCFIDMIGEWFAYNSSKQHNYNEMILVEVLVDSYVLFDL
jgi:hypothetical protein